MSAPGNVRKTKLAQADWQTPRPVFDALDREFYFDLDAAASAENALCKRYFTEERSAFELPWLDDRAFCNPPYGDLKRWIEQFILAAREEGATVVALLPNNTDTRWFGLVWETAHEVRFVTKRIQFVDPSGAGRSANTGGSIIAVWRPYGRVAPEPNVFRWCWE